ncbi:MAG: MBL fold metallo-hydrolase [Spirochaetia bacterium]|jgi:glyoxylase-like metal-dependent hydrolase (beta-lactamase superfamily II)
MVERVIVGPWKTNCYIFSSAKKECIIIDPGGSEEEIATRVDVLNMVPIGIALTHGHVDHLAALAKLKESYANRGYKLPIAINTADRRFLGTGGREIHRESLEFLGLDELSFFGLDPDELPKADVRLREGDRVFDMDIVVLETPGHTPGSVCFYAEKEGILFSGDTLFFDGVGRTDLPGGSEKKLRESIVKKIAVLPPETRVFPGHGPFTTVEREKRGNIYFRTVPQEAHPAAAMGPTPSPSAKKTSKTARPVKKSAGAKHAARPAPKGRAPARGAKHAARPVKKSAGAKHAARRVKRRAGASSKNRTARLVKKRAVRPARAAGGVKKPSKGSTLKKMGKLTARARGKKRSQPTRSTKAPGSGRKPAR